MEVAWSTAVIPTMSSFDPQANMRQCSRRRGRQYSVDKSCGVRPVSTPLLVEACKDAKISRRRSRTIRFADEAPGGQLVDIIEVECFKSEYVPELWSKSLCPLWSCRECTLVNEKPDALACLLCGTPRWENDVPMAFLDGIALRTASPKNVRRSVAARPGTPSRRTSSCSGQTQPRLNDGAVAEMHRSVTARPGTPSRRSSSCSGQTQPRLNDGAVAEMPEMQLRRNVKISEGVKMSEGSAKMSGPQVPPTSSAVRASTAVGGVTRAKKDSAEQRSPHRQITEGMIDSLYAHSSLEMGSHIMGRKQSAVTKSPSKAPSPFRRLNVESLDLPPIGPSPKHRIKSGTHRLDEPEGPQPLDCRPRSSLY